jgi:hypothetical protein
MCVNFYHLHNSLFQIPSHIVLFYLITMRWTVQIVNLAPPKYVALFSHTIDIFLK